MKFKYLLDPLFLVAFVLYWCNRFLIKPHVDGGFVHNHLNDFLVVPFWIPFLVLVLRVIGIRDHDRRPTIYEIVLPIVVWSIQFELIYPHQPFWSEWAVSDPADVVWYCLGGFLSWVLWHFLYRENANHTDAPMKEAVSQI